MAPSERPTNPPRFVRVSGRPRAGAASARDAAAIEGADAPAEDAPSTAGSPVRRPSTRGARGMASDAFQVPADAPTLADHWSVLRRRRGLIAICTLVAVTLAAVWMWVRPPGYTAESTVVIRPIAADAFQDTRIEDVGAPTEAIVVGSTVVAEIAARRIGEPASAADRLRAHVTATNPAGTLLLRIAFSGDSARFAQVGSQAFAEAYLEYRRATADGVRDRALARIAARRAVLDTQLAAAIRQVNSTPAGSEARTAAEVARDGLASRIGNVNAEAAALDAVVTDPGQIIRPASLPSAPSGPPIVVILVAAAVLGALLGAVLALVRDRTDPHISSRRAMTAVIGIEPLAMVPAIGAPNTMPALSDPEGRVAGALRRLRVSVWPQRGDGPSRIVVASPSSEAAADVVAGNLALTLALAGWSTLLAWSESGDGGAGTLRHTDLARYGADPAGRLVHGAMGVDGLSLLSLPFRSGRAATASEQLAARLDDLSGGYDVEIIVAESLMRSADAFEASPLSDAMIVVVDVAGERREDLAASVEALDAIGAPLEGFVAYAAPKGW